jgi:hypothetical protein
MNERCEAACYRVSSILTVTAALAACSGGSSTTNSWTSSVGNDGGSGLLGNASGGGSSSSSGATSAASTTSGSSSSSGAPSSSSGSSGSAPADAGGQPPEGGGGMSVDAAGSSGALSGILVPSQGALLGHYYGNGTLAQTDAIIGRKPALHLAYFNWAADDWATAAAADFADGRIPLVNWEPYDAAGGMVSFDDIVSGKYDSYIQGYAAKAKAFGKKFFIDLAAEMNSDEAWTNHDAAKYIAGWRHVHDIFTAAGATNVVWAWCPNVTDSDGSNSSTMSYYPGDSYVDWTGVDGYNWGTSQPGFSWQSFQDVFMNIYPLLAAKGKPILIGEMASDEVGGSKAQWIADIVPTMKTSFPMIKAFAWFDVMKERNWEINSSASTATAYAQMARDPYMNP